MSWLLRVLAAVALVHAQQRLPLNTLDTFFAPTSVLALPASPQLAVAVAICTPDAADARFFLSNTSGTFEIQLDAGSGHWTGPAPSGGLLSVQDLAQGSFQVSVTDNGATFRVLEQLPLLGDTTASQAILFSPAFLPVAVEQPSYPNYTLPPANLSAPDIPASVPNLTLVLAPTSAQLSSLPQTACALLNASSAGSIVSNGLWLRDPQGWRSQWLVDGLSPSTNYTAYVVQDALSVSGPIFFATKSGKSPPLSFPVLSPDEPTASFSCPLVYSLPYCPSTAYAVPLPPPPSPTFGYDATSLPDNISSPLLQYMTNFTTMLTTFACGRDLYSPLQSCADCQTHYRAWLCSVSFPRCTEGTPATQSPLSALQPQPSGTPSRNPFFPNATYDYVALLPCLDTCNAIDRACPYFMGIKCPTTAFNAAASYGLADVAQDRWGNVWCNGS